MKTHEEQADDFYQKGYNALANDKKYNDAIKYFSQVIRINPNSFLSFYHRGGAYFEMKQYKKALSDMNETIKLKPDYAEAYNGLGAIYLKLKEYDKAIPLLTKCIQLIPNSFNTIYNRAVAFYEIGDYEKSILDTEESIRLNPFSDKTHINRGNIFLANKNYEEALNSFSKAIDLNPSNNVAYNNRAAVYMIIGEFEKAIPDILEALKIEPNNPEYHHNLGVIYSKLDDKVKDALFCYDKAIDLSPKYYNAFNSRGILYEKTGDYTRALSDYNTAIKLNSNYSEAYKERASVYWKMKEFEKSVIDYNKAIELNESYLEAYINRGALYLSLEKYDNALSDFNKAIQIDPNSYNAYSNRGVVYYHLSKYDEAISDYTSSIRINPTNYNAYSNRGVIFYKRREYDDAIADYKKTIQLNPSFYTVYHNLANVYYDLKKYPIAIDNYSKAISLNPHYHIAYAYRGDTYFEIKDYGKAIADYEKLIPIEPYYMAYYKRGCVYYELEEYSMSLKDCKMAFWLNPSFSEACLKIGLNLIQLGNDEEEAIKYLIESEKDILEIYHFVLERYPKDEDKAYNIVSSYLDRVNDTHFFRQTLIKHDISLTDNTLYCNYKHLYISSLRIILLLSINKAQDLEKGVAHYTSKSTIERLIFKNRDGKRSHFRQGTVITSNDSTEGKVLLTYLDIDSIIFKSDYQAFIGCFTFNHDCLNQFRLYGKRDKEEATGVSIVVNECFFNKIVRNPLESTSNAISTNDSTSIKSDFNKFYSLFRCVYLDPKTNQIISIGHKEGYTFFRDIIESESYRIATSTKKRNLLEKTSKEVKNYMKDIENLLIVINERFNKLKEFTIKNNKKLNHKAISDLLLNLRYLIKHISFKEEQECRIITIEKLSSPLINIPENNSSMYIEACDISPYINQIYFAPKTIGYNLFVDMLKNEGHNKIQCLKSDHPILIGSE